MSSDEIKQAFREVLREEGALGRCCATCDLRPHEHFQHHQVMREALDAKKSFWKLALRVGGSALIGFVLWSIWQGFKAKIAG